MQINDEARCYAYSQTQLFGRPKMQFHEMSEAVNRYLSNTEPVVLEYTVECVYQQIALWDRNTNFRLQRHADLRRTQYYLRHHAGTARSLDTVIARDTAGSCSERTGVARDTPNRREHSVVDRIDP